FGGEGARVEGRSGRPRTTMSDGPNEPPGDPAGGYHAGGGRPVLDPRGRQHEQHAAHEHEIGGPVARRPQSQPPVLPGYTYVRPLGAGGFADVFLYEQDMPRRVVAVKVLSTDAINAQARAQFVAEADVMARLSAHPSILT